MLRNRILPGAIIALSGAVIGSFLMMLYASTHFVAVSGPPHDPQPAAAAPMNSGGSDQDRIISAVKRVKPSVVAIDVAINGRQYIPVDPLMQQFFGQQGPGVVQPFSAKDSGSGFVYGSQGYIVTNAHVVRPMPNVQTTSITVVFPNGEKAPARIVAANIGADLAVLKVTDGHRLPSSLALADSDKLQQGQWAIAIGEPYELQQSVTVGVVSAFDRSEPIQTESGQQITFKGLLQTSAPINFGNSGGPLIDMNGNVIGVNQSTFARAQGIGFAIPSNTVKRVVDQMIAHPGITEPPAQAFMGVGLQQVTSGFRNQTNYRGQGGVAVTQVVSGSPADQAGIQPGDVILKLNGKSYNDNAALSAAIAKLKPGDRVSVEFWSGGTKRLAQITLGARPDMQQYQQQPDQQQEQDQQ